jgi:hypothetical protein
MYIRFQLLLKTFNSLEIFHLLIIIAHTQCEYGDAQGCQICIIMLWYDRNEISKLIIVAHLVAFFSMVGPPSPMCCPIFYSWGLIYLSRFGSSPKVPLVGLLSFTFEWWGSVVNSPLGPLPYSVGLGLASLDPIGTFHWELPQSHLYLYIHVALKCEV